MTTINAPFTEEQVVSINQWQDCNFVHPFTCGNCRDTLGTKGNDRKLIATDNGFICPTCDYTQNWCHDYMADGSVAKLNPWPEEAKNHVI